MTLLQEKNKPRVGVGIVVVKDGKVLLGKRKSSLGIGNWAFAGGHLEFGESVEDCAKRELAEETGLQALSLILGPWTNDLIENNKHYITLFVFVNAFHEKPQLLEPDKCAGWHWFDWDALPSPLFPPIRSLIQKLGLKNLKLYTENDSKFG